MPFEIRSCLSRNIKHLYDMQIDERTLFFLITYLFEKYNYPRIHYFDKQF